MGIIYDMYLRKSSEGKDRQAASIPEQERELKDLAQIQQLKVGKIFRESQSAHHKGRPLFNQMISEIQQNKANGILVWHLNRIARNPMDAAIVIELMDNGYLESIVTPNRTYRKNSEDVSSIGSGLVQSKKYSDDLSEAVKRGNKHHFLVRKKWLGMAKPGYLNTIDPVTREKIVVTDKERLPLLQKAIKLILSGSHTPMEALKELNSWGYRTRKTKEMGNKPLGKSNFYKILNDPFYYGKMTRSEGSIMGNYETIITEDQFNLLQARLGAHNSHSFTRHQFPYKGILKCASCHASITFEVKNQIYCNDCKLKFNKGKTTTCCPKCKTPVEEMKRATFLHYTYAHCTRKKDPACKQPGIQIEELEEQIKKELSRFEISESFKTWAIKYLQELNANERIDREIIREDQQKAYNESVNQLDKLLNMRLNEQISDNEYNQKRQALLIEKESMLTKINQTNKRIDDWLDLSERTFNFACYARYWFENGDLRTKTRILAALGSNLTINNKKLQVDGQKPFYLIEKCLQTIKAEAPEFEPAKEIDFTQQTPFFGFVRQQLLRGRDSDPDRQLQRLLSYH